jgi:hypothetical protein
VLHPNLPRPAASTQTKRKSPNQLTQFTKETNKLKSKYTNLHCSGRAGKKQKPGAAQEASEANKVSRVKEKPQNCGCQDIPEY